MAFVVWTCPQCTSQKMRADILYAILIGERKAYAFFVCPNCLEPVMALLENGYPSHWPAEKLVSDPRNVSTDDWKVVRTWPTDERAHFLADVPTRIADAYAQAEKNFVTPGCEEAAAIMYRKTVELALGQEAPGKDSLYNRIEKLAADGRFSPQVAEWAHEVRLLGNEAAHGIDPPTRGDLKDLRGISEMLLRYLFVLPAMIRRRREHTAQSGEQAA